MNVMRGIVSNCSETVYRISIDDWELHKDALKDVMGSLTPVQGYSSLRPTTGTICVYFYQTFGGTFMAELEKRNIPYDTEQWMTFFDFGSPNFDEITESREIQVYELEEQHDVDLEPREYRIHRRKSYES